MKYILLIILLCQSALGQEYGFGQLPILSGGSSISVSNFPTSGLFLRWRDIDLPASGSVSNWVDEIQGIHLVATNNMPSMTPTGLVFSINATLYSTNTSANQYGSAPRYASFVVFSVAAGLTGPNTWLLFDDGAVLPGENQTFLPNNYNLTEFSASGSPSSVALSGVINTNELYDWVMGTTNSVSVSYTNGVWSRNITGIFPGWQRVGLGAVPSRIREIAIWTNLDLTSVTAFLHNYRVSTYGN